MPVHVLYIYIYMYMYEYATAASTVMYVHELLPTCTYIRVFSRDILKGGNNIGVRAGGREVLGV